MTLESYQMHGEPTHNLFKSLVQDNMYQNCVESFILKHLTELTVKQHQQPLPVYLQISTYSFLPTNSLGHTFMLKFK